MLVEQPLVSIITLTYNHKNFIGDCIKSVQAQTYPNWEMLIIDDGSTDSTFSIVSSFAKTDERIKVFTQKNIGVFRMKESYNFALLHSKGKYIAILDGDDIWINDKLEIQIPLLEKNENAILCFGQAYRSSNDLQQNISLDPNTEKYSFLLQNNDYELKKQLILESFIPALTVVTRKASLDRIGGFIQTYNLPLVDLPTWLELSLLGSFIFVDKPLGKWRQHGNEVTLTHILNIKNGLYYMLLDFYKTHKDEARFESITAQMIYNRFYNKHDVIIYSRIGRKTLSERNYSNAVKYYWKSIRIYGFSFIDWKLRSLIGLFFAVFHLDMEKFIVLLGRKSL